MASPDDSTPSGPDDAHVNRLRRMAQQAVQASVHHAELSQHYMELSQRFAALAEQAVSGVSFDVNREARRLEQQLQAGSESNPELFREALISSGKRMSSVESLAAASLPANAGITGSDKETTFSAFSENRNTASDSEFSARAGAESAGGGNAVSKPHGARVVNVRKVVERNRAARLAAANRVRVRAQKADLQPKLRSTVDELKKGGGSYVSSGAVLAVALLLMSLRTWQLDPEVRLPPMTASFAEEIVPIEEPVPVEMPVEEIGEQTEQPVAEPEPEPVPEPDPVPEPLPMEEAQPAESTPEDMAPDVPVPDVPGTMAEPAAEASGAKGGETNGDAGRQALLQKFGGSAASESAVQLGLEWLLSIQQPDGSWDFRNVGQSGGGGSVFNPIGATAYAVMPFLAAGQTHQSGSYQKQIGAALTYLTKVGVNVPAGYDLRGMINKQSDDDAPNEAYYVHGTATLALCEAYALTKDRRLKKAAEDAIRFIVNSQDPQGGGWRYNPQEPGSTSVTAIQVMALMAARKAGIRVDDRVLQKVMKYLDSVQVDGEGRYGYEIRSKQYKGSITAMALLCRMYLGWGRDDGDMRAGIELLDKAGPYDNLYTLYFATQVMKNWGGEEWERWNSRLRDDLIAWQEAEGPAKGSWKPRTAAIHAKQGGRLLTTVLATLTLEVYYRYKPLLPEPDSAVADPAIPNAETSPSQSGLSE
ncbi:MAG: prenyltransferase/squalene oxidase repeat-containing protein [Planctomycetaceae bacterium]